MDPRSFEFSPKASFWDVDGIPVTRSAGNGGSGVPFVAAWDSEDPRPFPPDSLRRNGGSITKPDFFKLVDEARASRASERD